MQLETEAFKTNRRIRRWVTVSLLTAAVSSTAQVAAPPQLDPSGATPLSQTTNGEAAPPTDALDPAPVSSVPDPATNVPAQDVEPNQQGTPATGAAPRIAGSDPSPILDEDPNEFGFLEQQIGRGEASSAAASLEVIVRQIETTHHRYHEDLVKPLTLLGDAQIAQAEQDAAIDTYARARHIARVSHGLFGEEQLPIVYREANVFKDLGDMELAAEREEYAFEVARRAYAAPDPRAIPALTRLATFYINTYNPISARTLLMNAMAVHQQNGTDRTPQAIPLLRGIAQTHRMSRFPPFYVTNSDDNRLEGPRPGLTTGELDGQFLILNSFPEGERALQTIVAIQQENFPDQPTLELDAILELADWHLLFGRYQAAHSLYNHVFLRMAELNQRPEEFFATPAVLYFPRPDNPRSPPSGDRAQITEGMISLGFTVTPNGHVRTLKTLASEPPKLMDFRVRRSMRIAKFRPRYVEGQAVAAEDQTFTYRFPYYVVKDSTPPMQSDTESTTQTPEPGNSGITPADGPGQIEPDTEATTDLGKGAENAG